MQLSLSDISFIIVDDSAHMRRIVVTMLRGFGARQIFEAEDGVDGLEKIDMNAPDIVISDWVMPVLDGGEMVKMIRTPAFPLACVPIIMLTAYTEKSRVLQSIDLGVDHVLCKPVSARTLYDRIADCILRPRTFVKSDHYYGPERRGKKRLSEEKSVLGDEQNLKENQDDDSDISQDAVDALFD